MYLCYDIRGIQQFIFGVPKLKCVIGASGIVDAFDREWKEKRDPPVWETVYAGGGRGALACRDAEAAQHLRDQLVAAAKARGLDVRIGMNESLSVAALRADQLYPCMPESLEQQDSSSCEPCAISGLWPVAKGAGRGPRRDVHPLIWDRLKMAKKDHLGARVLQGLEGRLPELLRIHDLQFFKTVTYGLDDSAAEEAEAKAGQRALGSRNRWAIVAMDGNDMGRQFLVTQKEKWPEEKLRAWLKTMSSKLADCTWEAFLTALARVLDDWVEDVGPGGLANCCYPDAEDEGKTKLVLPFRPLIIGGDDVVMLCHSAYALAFVRYLAAGFHELSRAAVGQSDVRPLWPATGDALTISGGILFAKVTFPLHMAIPYAESLLGNAKGTYRRTESAGPTPAAIDWDAITDTLVDTPAARRRRELRFWDEELQAEIQLTRRPYVLEADGKNPDLESLLELTAELRGVPASVRARVLPSLRRPWSERIAFVASVAKRQEVLRRTLWEGSDLRGTEWFEQQKDPGHGKSERSRRTGVPDALLLLEEEHRRQQRTARE